MAQNKDVQVYRAGVGALILDSDNNVLLIQNHSFGPDEWDFVKGGMHLGESEEDTLRREINEEVGENFEYEIIERSSWNVIYEWPKERQEEIGMRGQARISYWVRQTGGEVNIDEEEIRAFTWVPANELKDFLIKSGWQEYQYIGLIADLERILV